jgi:hypothetical protein
VEAGGDEGACDRRGVWPVFGYTVPLIRMIPIIKNGKASFAHGAPEQRAAAALILNLAMKSWDRREVDVISSGEKDLFSICSSIDCGNESILPPEQRCQAPALTSSNRRKRENVSCLIDSLATLRAKKSGRA